MISFEELDKRIRKQYPAVLKAVVLGENLFPLYLRASKTAEQNFTERHQKLEALYRHSSHHHPHGYLIQTETVQRRLHGLQDEPVAFYFDTQERYLGYIGKQQELEAFTADCKLLLANLPGIQPWLAGHVAEVLQYHGHWSSLIQVALYFLKHPLPKLFIRELPLEGLSTKFVEHHKPVLYSLLNAVLPPEAINSTYPGLSQFEHRYGLRTDGARLRFRWLCNTLAQRYTGGLNDLSAPVVELAACNWQVQKVIVLENKTNLMNADLYLTLPEMENTMAIFGSGRAAALLAKLPWLQSSAMQYWGDIDAEGFEIYHDLLQFFPQAKPLCMNEATWLAFKHEVIAGSGATQKPLPLLAPAQASLYRYVCTHNLRLEQERISQAWVVAQLLEG